MIRYKCTVAYIGKDYQGWQSQRQGNTIQDHIEQALFSITQKKVDIVGAGRTDAGVSALGQVFHYDTDLKMTPYKWKGALNTFLPKDIRIVKVEECDELFHARYCVKEKCYEYRIHLGEYDVFSYDRAYQCPYSLDIKKMKEAAKLFVGTHDFSSFTTSSYKEKPDQVRTITSIVINQDGDDISIVYKGRGFLRYMVRMMSAELIEIGKGKLDKKDIIQKLNNPSKQGIRKNAPSEGLTLVSIDYFEILALDSKYMIRDVLPEDNLKGYRYCFVTRNSQEVLGAIKKRGNTLYFDVFDKHNLKQALKLANNISKFNIKFI